ncbi:protein of unassigned function [Methylobacterium oryzae CBMB20]|uniref:Protein of unassigned function n=1 Tax=Methylobacterium oryzae CBMB20 TaxID=693986 RepID=A0A089NMM0_9HYPH|nr:protein of unassigned function [Methylobacterium oryzae CBMB20]
MNRPSNPRTQDINLIAAQEFVLWGALRPNAGIAGYAEAIDDERMQRAAGQIVIELYIEFVAKPIYL